MIKGRQSLQWWMRALEAPLSIVLLGTCGHVASAAYGGYGGIGLGIFTALLAAAASGLYLAAPRIPNAAVCNALPGLVDLIASALLAIFALSAAAATASLRLCTSYYGFGGYSFLSTYYTFRAPAGVCAAWALAVVSGFLLAAAFGTSAALAALDMRAGLGLWCPAGWRANDDRAGASDGHGVDYDNASPVKPPAPAAFPPPATV